MPSNHKTTVFYDGDCPLCSREIALYKRLDKAKKINWIDINHSQVELSAEGIDYQDAMTLMHVKDSEGNVQIGIKGIMALWKQLPYYQRLVLDLNRLPFIYRLLGKAYIFFAPLRLKLPRKHGEEKRL